MEVENAMNDLQDYANRVDESSLSQNISMLNSDQLRIFNKITESLQNGTRIRTFMSGFGGTGKSLLIKTIVQWNKIVRNKYVAVAAPTGIAALAVDGSTAHRLLSLPVERDDGTLKYKSLSNAARKRIRESFKNVDLIIIDEASMISNVILMFIHFRLTEIFDTSDTENGFFGNVNILLCGDLLQLPPVKEG